MEKSKYSRVNIKRGIRVFLFITIITITLILVFTVSEDTREELKLISPLFLLLTLLSTSLRFLFDIWRLRFIIKAMGKELSWLGAFHYTLGGLFLGGLTPMQVGGIPLQLYICRREGIPIPEGSAAIFTRGMLSAFVLPFLIPFMYLYRTHLTSGWVEGVVTYLIILYGVMTIFFLIILTRTTWITRHFRGKFVEGIVRFKEVFRREFIKRKSPFLKAYGMTWLSLAFYFLTAPLLLRGLGIKAPFLETTILQIVLTYAINFMPTPGASGFAEGGAYALFHHLMPRSVLGVYVILWRFFTGYVGIIVGGFALAKLFSTITGDEKVLDDAQGEGFSPLDNGSG
ncbi:flippase-like domain-containing protein [candidate division WOR-3 bacterium]|nr:flippase-like domain-containing protein [candidate division WOR-3 bacterium]